MIPPLLHFIWIDLNGRSQSFPDFFYDSWKKHHPTWEIRVWDRSAMDEFVQENFPEFVEQYHGYATDIQRTDFFRYLILDKLGGVYADLDIECYKSIDEFRSARWLFQINSDGMVTNAFMGTAPDDPIWKRAQELAKQRAQSDDVLYSTGPKMLNEAVSKAEARHDPDIRFFPFGTFLFPYWPQKKRRFLEKSFEGYPEIYGVHRYHGKWVQRSYWRRMINFLRSHSIMR